MNKITENTNITELSFRGNIEEKLITNNISTIGELSNLSILEMMNLQGIHIADIYSIKEILNNHNYHFIGENFIDKNDLFDNDSKKLLERCELLLELRNKIRGKEGFQAEEIVLCQEIMNILIQIEIIRITKIDDYYKELYSTYKR